MDGEDARRGVDPRDLPQFGDASTLPALDKAIGLRRTFLDFAKHGWNQKPLEPSFVSWDKLPLVPQHDYKPIVDQHLFLAGQKTRTANVPYEPRRLARDYNQFTITDEKVREVVFRNPLAANPDARIGAILTFKSGADALRRLVGQVERALLPRQPGPGRRVARRHLRELLDEGGRDNYISRDADARTEGRVRRLPVVLQGQGGLAGDEHSASRAANDDHICGTIAGLPISGQKSFKVAGAELPFSTEQSKVGCGGEARRTDVRGGPGTMELVTAWLHAQTRAAGVRRDAGANAEPDGNWSVGFSLRARRRQRRARRTRAIPTPNPASSTQMTASWNYGHGGDRLPGKGGGKDPARGAQLDMDHLRAGIQPLAPHRNRHAAP